MSAGLELVGIEQDFLAGRGKLVDARARIFCRTGHARNALPNSPLVPNFTCRRQLLNSWPRM